MPALEALRSSVVAPDPAPGVAARRRLDSLTKPAGSLGALEEVVVRLATIAGTADPRIDRRAIFTLVADHGVAERGVSAYPRSVTAQMAENFLRGGAAINVLARQAGARLIVADFGIAVDPGDRPGLVRRRIGPGTEDIGRGPAMTRADAERAIEAGAGLVAEEVGGAGLDLIGTGEMGIGNTTAASALVAVLARRPPEQVTGRGTGVEDTALRRKVAVVAAAIATNRPDPADPLGVLASLGGFEIAGLVGVILAGAAHRVPVVLDGFIAGAAALVAVRLAPAAAHYLIAGHRSAEPGHRIVLDGLGLDPLLDLRLRLGEGTGAAIAMRLLDAAIGTYREMATFSAAGVSQREGRP